MLGDRRTKFCRDALYPRRDILLLLPGLAGFFLFYVYPFFLSAYYSVIKSNQFTQFVGLHYYKAILQNTYYLLALKNTAFFLIFSVPFCLMLGFCIAHFFWKHRNVSSLAALVLIPVFIPSSAVICLWRILFSRSAWAARILPIGDDQWKYASLFMLFIWKIIGAVTALLMGGLFSLDRDILSAACIDGASGLKMLRKILLPLLRPNILFSLAYLAMNALRTFKESYLLFGAYPPNNLYLIQNYINNHFVKLNYQYLSAGAVLFAMAAAIFFLALWGCFRLREGGRV